MKPGAGKNKGSAFERTCARRLSLWLTDGQDRTQLVRSVLSGGWGTVSSRHDGDLAANGAQGEEFLKHFVVECKHYKTIDLWGYWTQKDGGLVGRWWRKLWRTPAVKAGQRTPLLIFQANGRPALVGLPSILQRYYPFLDPTRIHNPPTMQLDQASVMLLALDDLLTYQPDTVYAAVEQSRKVLVRADHHAD